MNAHDTLTASAPPRDRLVSLRSAASRLGLSTRTIYRLIDRGELPVPVKVGGATRFFESDLNVYLESLRSERERLSAWSQRVSL